MRPFLFAVVFVNAIAFVHAIAASSVSAQEAVERSLANPLPIPSEIERSELPSERSYNYDFDNVDVQSVTDWIEWLGQELPVKLRGKVRGWIWVQRGAKSWLNLSDYRIEGELTSERLGIDEWSVQSSRFRFGYQDGQWYVNQLSGDFSSPGQKPIGNGSFSGLMKTGSGEVEIRGGLNGVQIDEVLNYFEQMPNVVAAPAETELRVQTTLADLIAPNRWSIKARTTLPSIRIESMQIDGLSFPLEMRDGTWKITTGNGSLFGNDFAWEAEGNLVEDLPFQFSVESKVALSALGDNVRQLAANSYPDSNWLHSLTELQGLLDVNATVSGNGQSGIVELISNWQSDSLSIGSIKMTGVSGSANLSPSSLQFRLHEAGLFQGQIAAELDWPLDSFQPLPIPSRMAIDVFGIDLSEVESLPSSIQDVVGNFDFQLRAESPDQTENWSDLTIDLRGRLSDLPLLGASNSQLLGVSNSPVWLRGSKSRGQPTFDWQLWDRQRSIESNGSLEFQDDSSISDVNALLRSMRIFAEGSLNRFGLQFKESASNPELRVQMDGEFSATASWNTAYAGLHLGAASCNIDSAWLEIDQQLFELHNLKSALTPNVLRVSRFELAGLGGTAIGSAEFRRDGESEHRVNLKVQDLHLEEIAALQSYLDSMKAFTTIHAVAGFELQARQSAQSDSFFSNWTADLNASLSEIELSGQPIGDIRLSGDIRKDLLQATVDGSLLSSVCSGNVSIPLQLFVATSTSAIAVREPERQFTGQLSLNQAKLGPLIQALHGNVRQTKIDGSGSMKFDFRGTEVENLEWSLNAGIERLTYENRNLARGILMVLRGTSEAARLEELSGSLAGGRIQSSGDIRWLTASGTNGSIDLDVTRADLGLLVEAEFPEYADLLDGFLTARGRILIGNQTQFRGTAEIQRGHVWDLPIQELKSPIFVRLNRSFQLESIHGTNLYGTILGGRTQGEFNLQNSGRLSGNTTLSIQDGKLDQMSRALGFEQIVGTGRFDANGQIEADDIFDFGTFRGPVQAKFESGASNSFPLVSELGRLLPAAQLAATQITDGQMKGRVGNGQLRVANLALNSNAFSLLASGSAGLTSHRLDLEAVLETGGTAERQLTQNLTSQILIQKIPQAQALAIANELLRNRTLFFHVGGTTHQPTIQLRTTETAIQVLLQQLRRSALPSASPGIDN